MYIFKFTDKRKDEFIEGNFPSRYAQELWEAGVKFIIISTYSNTIKVPRKGEYDSYDENSVEFDDFHM